VDVRGSPPVSRLPTVGIPEHNSQLSSDVLLEGFGVYKTSQRSAGKEAMASACNPDLDYYEELQARLRALLIAIGTWISTEQLSLFNELVDANELGIALDMLSEALVTSGARIDATLFRGMQSLTEQMKLKLEVVDRLRPLVE
jgi:hypothetical protein